MSAWYPMGSAAQRAYEQVEKTSPANLDSLDAKTLGAAAAFSGAQSLAMLNEKLDDDEEGYELLSGFVLAYLDSKFKGAEFDADYQAEALASAKKLFRHRGVCWIMDLGCDYVRVELELDKSSN